MEKIMASILLASLFVVGLCSYAACVEGSPRGEVAYTFQARPPQQSDAALPRNTEQAKTTADTNAAPIAASPKPDTTKKDDAAGKPAESPSGSRLCGAATKKGTPCKRRVKTPGHCYQHRGDK